MCAVVACNAVTDPGEGGGASSSGSSSGGGASSGTSPDDASSTADGNSGALADSSADGSSAGDGSADASTGTDGADGGTEGGGPIPGACSTVFPCAAGFKSCSNRCVKNGVQRHGCGNGCDPCPVKLPHVATPSTCAGDVCQRGGPAPICEAGWGNCDGNWSNGCEADLEKPSSCGTCGNVCAPGEVCDGGVCAAACTGGRFNCGNGACYDIATSVKACNCQPCGKEHEAPVCAGGVCDATACEAGYQRYAKSGGGMTDCIDRSSDPNACGANSACGATGDPAAAHIIVTQPTCESGVCTAVCRPGYGSCVGATQRHLPVCRNVATDSANCGSCDSACPAGSECRDAVCTPVGATTVVTGLGVFTPSLLAVDDTNLYYFDSGVSGGGGAGQGLWRVEKTTLARTQIVADVVDGIATDGTYVYWSGAIAGVDGIRRIPKAGGAIALLHPHRGAVLVDDTNVYWNATGADAGFWKGPKDGSAPATQLSTLAAAGFVQDGTKLYGSTAGTSSPHDLWSVDKVTGVLGGIMPGGSNDLAGRLALAADPRASRFMYARRELTKLVIDGISVYQGGVVRSMATDGCSVYWIGSTGLWRMALSGSGRYGFELSGGSPDARNIVIDDTYVYWTEGASVRRTLR